MTRIALALLVVVACAAPSQAQMGATYRIVADDGKVVANHNVPADSAAAVEKLPGAVIAGNPKGDVTIAEFYDLNCPYCRRASADMDAIIAADKNLRVILVPYPVLGVPSILASRVEISVAKTQTPQTFYAFHRRIYAGRGTIDDQRALAVVRELKIDESKIIAMANDDDITDVMKTHERIGRALGLAATPGYVIKGVAIVGHPGKAALERAIAAARKCGKVVC